jgi:hypothetical protein
MLEKNNLRRARPRHGQEHRNTAHRFGLSGTADANGDLAGPATFRALVLIDPA